MLFYESFLRSLTSPLPLLKNQGQIFTFVINVIYLIVIDFNDPLVFHSIQLHIQSFPQQT